MSGSRSTATCAAGTCGLTCETNFANCDGVATNGCEIDVTSSNTNCGRCGTVCGAGLACVAGLCESTACPSPTRSCTGSTCPSCSRVAFSENWESGTAQWYSPREGTGPVATATDASACTGSFLRETVRVGAGRVFTRNSIPVTGGRTYCVSSWVRGSAGTWPFIGMRASNATAILGAENWLIGQPCFPTGFGQPVAPVTSNGEWRWYAREFTMPAITHVVLQLELWEGGAAGTADFDQIQLLEGPCPQTAPVAVCSAVSCP
jgi:hypothetical protein